LNHSGWAQLTISRIKDISDKILADSGSQRSNTRALVSKLLSAVEGSDPGAEIILSGEFLCTELDETL